MRLPAYNPLALSPSSATPHAKIQQAAQQLETQFAQMLIKSMRSASMGDPMLGNNTTYREMYDQQLARELTKGRGLGLAPMIERQLERSTSPSSDVPTAPAQPIALPGAASSPMPLPAMPGLNLVPSNHGVSLSAFAPPMAAPTPAAAAATTHCDPSAPLDCSSPEAFVRSIWPHAVATAHKLGVSAKALVAQAALETGWGRRLVGHDGNTSHNLFGIKASGSWNGARVSAATHEYVGGVRQAQRADFRGYGSTAESFADFAHLLSGARYAAARGTGNDAHRFASALQHAGYATDPRYADKITAIANGATLNRALAALDASAGLTRVASNVVAGMDREG
jgi:flagellar protein FlgJ